MTNGIIIIDKPTGWTSHDVVAKVRGLFNAKKAGHTGTLDPLATGVLAVLLGDATKLSDKLMEGDKEYEVSIKFGMTTETYDLEGKTVTNKDVPKDLAELVRKNIPQFTGEILQRPPHYSAVKHNGKPLYYWARKGELIDLPPRNVTVREFDIISVDPPCVTARIVCSKGTYIRSICHDLGAAVGCGAVMAELRRTRTGDFHISDARTIPEIEATPPSERVKCLILL